MRKETSEKVFVSLWWLLQLCGLFIIGVSHIGHLIVVVLLFFSIIGFLFGGHKTAIAASFGFAVYSALSFIGACALVALSDNGGSVGILIVSLLNIVLSFWIIKRMRDGNRLFKCDERQEQPKPTCASIEGVKMKYGEPDDVVVLDASKANELSSLILFYSKINLMIVAGEEQKISDMTSVAPKNLATYGDDYAIIINTKNPQCPTIYLKVGNYRGLAIELAAQINAHITHA